MTRTNAEINSLRQFKNTSSNKLRSFEVWERDQYNQNTIIAETNTIQEAVAEAKKHVNDKNRNNPLTFDEQKRNWSHYLIQIPGDNIGSKLYGGNLIHGRHKILVVHDDNSVVEESVDLGKEDIRFYLGELPANKGKWIFEDARKRIVNRVDHPDVVGKTCVFIQKVREKVTR